MSIMGIVFSNLNDGNVSELTEVRTMGSVPFCGRYRLIDFALSSMVNSGISKVGVITKTNYQSLMDHLGSGKDWDLARKNGGLFLLPPFGNKASDRLYGSRLEALKGALHFIARSTEEHVVMSDSDCIYNMDLKEVVDYHEEKMSDITMVYRKKETSYMESKHIVSMELNENNRVVDISINPYKEGNFNQYIKVIVMKRQLLQQLVSEAISHGKTELERDVIIPALNILSVYGYEYSGYYGRVESLDSFYSANMDMLEKENRNSIFNIANSSIHTKVKDSPPTMYGDNAHIENSVIADGCVIDGEVINSIVFRGARIAKGAVVKNCIVMQDNIIGSNASLNAIITDKNVVVRDKIVLSGSENHPFFIRKGKIV